MLRGQSMTQTKTASVQTNPTLTNPRPQSSLSARSNKSPSNHFSGPPTVAIQTRQNSGQAMR
jgi:hypothetical protein